jgi:hypothetical protein
MRQRNKPAIVALIQNTAHSETLWHLPLIFNTGFFFAAFFAPCASGAARLHTCPTRNVYILPFF